MSIHVICGPMFSGKSTELLRLVKRHQLANKKCLIVKYVNDTRYSEEFVVTHDHQTSEKIDTIMVSQLKQVDLNYDVIGIDEGQFFKDIDLFAEQILETNILLIVATLDGDYNRRPFGNVYKILPLATSCKKLTAICNCGEEAPFTKRIIDNSELELIGGAEIYTPTCNNCYKK